jgi:thymidylate synthase (FAD)
VRIVEPSFSFESEVDRDRILRHIERAGRTCYKSEGKIGEGTAAAFVKSLVKRGHESVLEHVSLTVRVVCDRGVSHEIVRHRIASYSQESTRYCNYADDKFGGSVSFIRPFFWNDGTPGSKEKMRIWTEAMQASEDAYLALLEKGANAQEARSVLPNSLRTELVMTMDLREWRHFFKLRCSPASHPQMRELAVPMLAEFRRLLPEVFDDLGEAASY